MEVNEDMKRALLQSATAIFIHWDRAQRELAPDDPKRKFSQKGTEEIARDAAKCALSLWEELGKIV